MFTQFHAVATEDFLDGKILLRKKVLRKALEILDSELNPDHRLPDYSPEFRKKLAIGLFYKVEQTLLYLPK